MRKPLAEFESRRLTGWGRVAFLHHRVAQAKMKRGVDIYDEDVEVEGLGIEQLAKIRKSDQVVANLGVPEEDLSSDEEFDVKDLGAEDSEVRLRCMFCYQRMAQ